MPDLAHLTRPDLSALSPEDYQAVVDEYLADRATLRRENQIVFYEVSCPEAAQVHTTAAVIIGVGGGNRSGKTETVLVEAIACATGVFPLSFQSQFREKFRGPINVRVCIESLKITLHPIILPKLMWWRWQGIDEPGGERGHWGWVPRSCLINGKWEDSWSEKLCILRVLCRDPDDPDKVLGESTFQFMSYDQDPSDFASGTFHIVIHDEPPKFPIWRENQARVLDVAGRIFLSMTWPDDPSIAVDWIYDEVYEPGSPGPLKDPNIDWIELRTLDNRYLDKQAILDRTVGWSEETKKVKLEGQPLRFSNRVHPLFTDIEQTWCHSCTQPCAPAGEVCGCERASTDISPYCHVEDFKADPNWPVVYVIDPHPRKPHMMAWFGVDPNDDFWMIQEAEIEGDAPDVKGLVEDIEEAMNLDVRLRLMDPNMGRTPTAKRDITWQDEFENAGLRLGLADTSEVGRKRVNQYLKPDARTRRPRLMFHSRCRNAAVQMKRFVWDDFRRTMDREQKQLVKRKYDDYPAILRYLMNADPTFRMLYAGAPVISRPGTMKGGY